MRLFADQELFAPLHMDHVTLEFDGAGTFVGRRLDTAQNVADSEAAPLRICRQHISGNLGAIGHDQQTVARGQARVLHNAVLSGCRNRSTEIHVPELLPTGRIESV